MKKFDVEITETLQRKVSVEAASQEDAESMVTQAWNNQDYVLDSGDFTGVDFKTVGEHELAETRTMDVLLVQPAQCLSEENQCWHGAGRFAGHGRRRY